MVVLCTLALASGALAGGAGCCSEKDARRVLKDWEHVWGAEFTGRRVEVAKAVFEHLFEHHPDTKALFARVNVEDTSSPEFKAHCIRVVNGLDVAINLLLSPKTLKVQLAHLSQQHVDRKNIKAEYFTQIAESFLHVMPQVSPEFNPDAWSSCFGRIAKGISHGLP